MRIISATIGAALVASLALVGCDERHATTNSGRELAQSYLDAEPGVPNPMPGTPIADGGVSPISPTVPTPTEPAPGTPGSPRSPGSPGTPGTPGSPGTPGTPGSPGAPGSPSNPGVNPTTP